MRKEDERLEKAMERGDLLKHVNARIRKLEDEVNPDYPNLMEKMMIRLDYLYEMREQLEAE